jgi:hypothetical protein
VKAHLELKCNMDYFKNLFWEKNCQKADSGNYFEKKETAFSP